jgi:hypothetical protein
MTVLGLLTLLPPVVGAGCGMELGDIPTAPTAAEPRAGTQATPAAAMSEAQKIEALIDRVAKLDGAVFVRNDKEYDAKTAAEFLRRKWESKKDEIKTAEEFIAKIGSVSSTSGKPYLVRFKDGREVKGGDFLREELKKLR